MNASGKPRSSLALPLRLLRGAVIGGGLAWLGACAAAWTWQENLVFHPRRGAGPNPGARGLVFETVELETRDGVTLHGWYLPRPNGSEGGAEILFLHGNAGNVSNRLFTLAALHRLGHAVLIIDYRGYGLSEGSPTESGTYADAAAAWRYLIEVRGARPESVVVYGRSLGGAIAAQLASEQRPAAVILESTFACLAAMARHRFPLLPSDWLLRLHYDTRSRLPLISAPLLLAHSPTDSVVPFDQAATLLAAARSGTAFYRLAGDHNRAFRRGGHAYLEALDGFIRDALTGSGASANLCRRGPECASTTP